ncbi:TVP38/TMEM64 family protein [Lolliginicoccus levis]|uniref:TVP38/TMEM64 family protein n=1 Tax=Lolliginicoccus levis TaxID=2919542 RepID=UPI00241D36E7|nr:TVP38/TMEM64 family protein [Lolliginicoccus levis]
MESSGATTSPGSDSTRDGAAAQPVRIPIVRAALATALLIAAITAYVLAPTPTVMEMREWAEQLGPWFLALFAIVNLIAILFPIPRTIFTVTGGVLFGVVPGIVLSIAVGTIAALIALVAVRSIARDYIQQRISLREFHEVNDRLARRGWLAVASLRLIAPLPFSVVNYACGLSSIRVAPFALATVIGMLPGTTGVILLADAMTGTTNPILLLVSLCLIGLGVLGLLIDARTAAPEPRSATA